MRKFVGGAGLAVLFLFAFCAGFPKPAAAASKSGSGTIVIVFKDGHRQSFNLSDIERVEFPAAALAAADSGVTNAPPSGHYVGKWECGDGNGSTFSITLKEGGDALRSIGDVHGHWAYVNGEAQVTWDDGKLDAIRKVGTRYQKRAYHEGRSFTDQPDNVTEARLANPRPI